MVQYLRPDGYLSLTLGEDDVEDCEGGVVHAFIPSSIFSSAGFVSLDSLP